MSSELPLSLACYHVMVGGDGFERWVVIFFLCLEPLDLKPLTEMCIWLIPAQRDPTDYFFCPFLTLFRKFALLINIQQRVRKAFYTLGSA